MKTIRVYQALCIKDAAYSSGRIFLIAGEKCLLQVYEEGQTYFVKGEHQGLDQTHPFVFSSNDQDWVWKHLICESNPFEGKEEVNGNKEESYTEKAARVGLLCDGRGPQGGVHRPGQGDLR